jgi:hypothetical protein
MCLDLPSALLIPVAIAWTSEKAKKSGRCEGWIPLIMSGAENHRGPWANPAFAYLDIHAPLSLRCLDQTNSIPDVAMLSMACSEGAESHGRKIRFFFLSACVLGGEEQDLGACETGTRREARKKKKSHHTITGQPHHASNISSRGSGHTTRKVFMAEGGGGNEAGQQRESERKAQKKRKKKGHKKDASRR